MPCLLAAHAAFDIPIEDPILKFLLIMAIVLGAPLLLDRLKIPHLLGLIIAGAVIGPHGLNLVLRDSSIILSGTAGMLYILFLAGLEMDMADFKRNSLRSLLFGLYTFVVPMLFGIAAGRLVLGYPLLPSILMAALFASQTLIAYPIVSKLGIARDSAVTIAVGGTIVVDILALVTLTVVAGIATGNADSAFGYRLAASIAGCGAVILGLFPPLGRRFFKRCSDSTLQYVFVLVTLFLGAYLTQLAGLEPIIGAFLAGLAMNRLIPSTSPLMNRIGFVGDAIFIPFFLLGVGAGQMNRIGSAEIALKEAQAKGATEGLVMASDGFFPFDDCVTLAAANGVAAIVQPGGSVRDEDSIRKADETGVAMLFTGMRHFKH